MSFTAPLLAMLVAAALPPAPADGIRDDGRVLSEKGRAVLVKEMEAFTKNTGLVIFLETNTFLQSSTNTWIRAEKLLPAWAGQGAGVLMCVDRSSQSPPGIQLSEKVWQQASDAEVLASLDEVLGKMTGRTLTEEVVIEGLRELMTKLTELRKLANARSRVWTSSDLKLAAAFLSCLLLGAVTIRLLSGRLGRTEDVAAQQYYFPDVSVGQRFGAPYGGGVIVETTYRREL